MNSIIIIGGGFSGTLLAVQIIKKAEQPLILTIINPGESFNRGIAYSSYSDSHLLNVTAGKMSAFPDEPDSFLNWALKKPQFQGLDSRLVQHAFLSRNLYGEYLEDCWKEAVNEADKKNIELNHIAQTAIDLTQNSGIFEVRVRDGSLFTAEHCVLATGNQLPKNPAVQFSELESQEWYLRDPWSASPVDYIRDNNPVLILGHGLSMVDTILEIQQKGRDNGIISISPNGFRLMPHLFPHLEYPELSKEVQECKSLIEIVNLFLSHYHKLITTGYTAELLAESLRPITQIIWQKLNQEERKLFLSRYRPFWDIARHRIPPQIHKMMTDLQISTKLKTVAGKLISIKEEGNEIKAEYFDHKRNKLQSTPISCLINCTGPNPDLSQSNDPLLLSIVTSGLVCCNELSLGLKVDTITYQLIDSSGMKQKNFFTLGANMKGELWETIAVRELRQQATVIAECILSNISGES